MESGSESPFRRDEPVFSSRKWLLIAFISAFAWLIFTVYVKGRQMTESEDWGMDLFWLVLQLAAQITVVGFLFHALRSVWRSGERRSFELIGIAVKSQRGFFVGITILIATGSVFFAMWAHEYRGLNTGLKQRAQAYRIWRENARRAPAPPPSAEAPPVSPRPPSSSPPASSLQLDPFAPQPEQPPSPSQP